MYWTDIAGIVFTCTTMNHLGLIGKLEEIMGGLPILNCPKCCSFWATLFYGLCGITSLCGIIPVLAVSFLASYLALWLELLEGYIDTIYIKMYEKIYSTSDNTIAADAYGGDTAGTLSDLQPNKKSHD